MGLGDPFSTTYEGSRQAFGTLGEGIKGIAESFSQAKRKQQEMDYATQKAMELKRGEADIEMENEQRRMQSIMPTLQQFGIFREEEEPITAEEIKNFAKERGVEIALDPNLPEETQLSHALRFSKELGLPTPQPKKKMIMDAGKMAELGMQMSSKGEFTMKPESPLDIQLKEARIKALTSPVSQDALGLGLSRGEITEDPESILEGLPENTKALIRGVVDYDVDPKRMAPSRTGQGGQIRGLVSRYAEAKGQKWDEGKYERIQTVKKAFNTGKQGDALRSGSVAAGHAATLYDIAQQLPEGSFRSANEMRNAIKRQLGDKTLAKFDVARQAVSTEVSKFLKGVGTLSKDEIEDWKKIIDASMNRGALNSAIGSIATLMGEQFQGLNTQYKKEIGKDLSLTDLTPQARKFLKDNGVEFADVVEKTTSLPEGITEEDYAAWKRMRGK